MKQMLCLFLSLILVCAPAYSTTATHGPAHPRTVPVHVHARTVQRTTKTRANAATNLVRPTKPNVAETLPKQTALMGQLVFDEVEPPVPDAPAASEETNSKPTKVVTAQTPQQDAMEIKEATSWFPASHLLALLKGLSFDSTSRWLGTTDQSWVSELSADQSLSLAHSIAAYLAHQVPAESTTVRLAPLPQL
ncbi:MAG: hypothetical protein K2Z81_11515, partial [Cyanobacteria bacterium]|nr:hypothetical protein [Cyanobacteriota bacterium]